MSRHQIKLVGAAIALTVGAAVVYAAVPARPVAHTQTMPAATTPADHAKARLNLVANAVGNLTDDQKSKILAVYTKAYQSQADLRAKSADAETVRDVMEKADSDAKNILTGEQKSKMPSGRALRGA